MQCNPFLISNIAEGVLLGQYAGPGWTDQPPVTFSEQAAVGQYVVVQRNSHGNINIAEIYVINDQESK